MRKPIMTMCCLLAAFLSGSISATAQKGTYNVLSDDPATFKKLFVNINLVEIELASPVAWRPGIGAEYTLNRKLYFFADYSRSLFPMATVDASNKNQSSAEAGTIFSFASNVSERTARLHIKAGVDHYKWKIKAKALKQFGLHAGLNSFNTYKENGSYYAYANTASIFAGFAITTTRNIIVDIAGKGAYSCSTRSIWYTDLLLAPSVAYSDATDYASYGSTSTATPLSFPKPTKSLVGARMGYMKYSKTFLPMRQGFEFGVRPGIGSGVYFALRADISIGFMKGESKNTSSAADDKK